MLFLVLISLFLLFLCIFESFVLIKDQGIFAKHVTAAIEMLHKEGVISTIFRTKAIVQGMLLENISFKKCDLPTCKISIAFYPTGGLGDYIVSAVILEEIQQVADCYIDVYVENMIFGEAIYGNREYVRVKNYCDFEKRRSTYDLALMVEHFIHVKNYRKKRLETLSPELYRKIHYIKSNWKSLYISIPQQYWRERVLFDRCKLLGLDRWTELRMGDAFEVLSKKIIIPTSDKYQKEWEDYILSNKPYITINCGAGVINRYGIQQKTWSEESWQCLIKKVKKEFHNIEIIQIGAKCDNVIEGVDQALLGQDLELIKCVLQNSKVHVGCEGGMVHLATQLGVKCVVMFGPTPIHMYSYDQNVNLVGEQCNDCMGVSEKWAYECIGKNRNICMKSIKVEDVYDACKKILERTVVDETAKEVD